VKTKRSDGIFYWFENSKGGVVLNVDLPVDLRKLVRTKASQLGLSPGRYLKGIILRDLGVGEDSAFDVSSHSGLSRSTGSSPFLVSAKKE
jgi:hypothetical protein